MYKIIDIHTHTYPNAIAERAVSALEQFYDFICEGKGTVSDLAESSKKASLAGMLLLSVATNEKQIKNVNLWAANAKAQLIDRGFEAAAFGGIHQNCASFEDELDSICSLGLSGIKIHPDIQGVNIDDKRMYELYYLCEGKLPIYFHMGDDRPKYRFSKAERLIKILKEFPRLQVIAAHFGGYKAWDMAGELVRVGGENIMFDTSSALWALGEGEADKLVGILGAEHLMFGTDYPVMRAENELKLFMQINLTEKQREDILYNNAKNFLKFDSKAECKND